MSAIWNEIDILVLTLKVGLAAVALDLPPALLAARLLAHRRFPGRALVETVLNLPLVLPPVASGLVLLYLMAPASPLGRALEEGVGLRLVFTWPAAALAAAVVSFPLMLRSVLQGFEAIDPRLGEVARTLGARPMTVFLKVHLPLAAPGIIAGAIMGFARAIGEFGATIMVAGSIPGRTRTLPIAIYHRVQTGDAGGAMRLALLSSVLALALVALGGAAERRLRRDA